MSADKKESKKSLSIESVLSKYEKRFKGDGIESNSLLFDDICKGILGKNIKFDAYHIKHLLTSTQSLSNVKEPFPGSRFYTWEMGEDIGWVPEDFFAVHLRCLVETYYNNLLIDKDKKSANFIKNEIKTLLDVIVIESSIEKSKQELNTDTSNYIKVAYKHIKFVEGIIDSMGDGDTFLSHASIPAHSFYILYYKKDGQTYAAIHNLGFGSEPYVSEGTVPVYVIQITNLFAHLTEVFSAAVIPNEHLVDNNGEYTNEAFTREILYKIYLVGGNLFGLHTNEIAQTTGNCVVKNYLHAMLTRLGKEGFNKVLRMIIGTLKSNLVRIEKGNAPLAKVPSINNQLASSFSNYDPAQGSITLHARKRDLEHAGSYSSTWFGSDSDVEVLSNTAGLIVAYGAYQSIAKKSDDGGTTILKLSVAALAGWGSSHVAQKALQGIKDSYVDPEGIKIVSMTLSSSSLSLNTNSSSSSLSFTSQQAKSSLASQSSVQVAGGSPKSHGGVGGRFQKNSSGFSSPSNSNKEKLSSSSSSQQTILSATKKPAVTAPPKDLQFVSKISRKERVLGQTIKEIESLINSLYPKNENQKAMHLRARYLEKLKNAVDMAVFSTWRLSNLRKELEAKKAEADQQVSHNFHFGSE